MNRTPPVAHAAPPAARHRLVERLPPAARSRPPRSSTVGCASAAAAASASARSGRERAEPGLHQRSERHRQPLARLELQRCQRGARGPARGQRRGCHRTARAGAAAPGRGGREPEPVLDQALHGAEAQRRQPGSRADRPAAPAPARAARGSPPSVRQATADPHRQRRRRRRAAKRSTSSDGASSHWTSSTASTSGRSSASRPSTPSRPSATLCWSGGSPSGRRRSSATSKARRCRGGSPADGDRVPCKEVAERGVGEARPRPRPGRAEQHRQPRPDRRPASAASQIEVLPGARPRPRCSGAPGAVFQGAPRKSSTRSSSSSLPTSSALTDPSRASLPQGVPRSGAGLHSARPRLRPPPARTIPAGPCRAP